MIYLLVSYLSLIHYFGAAVTLFVLFNAINSLEACFRFTRETENSAPGCMLLVAIPIFGITTYIGVTYLSWLNTLLT